MRVRAYGLLVLGAAGVLPMVAFGYLAIDRSQKTAIEEAREGNQRLAIAIAGRIGAYLENEKRLLDGVGMASLLAQPRDAQLLLDAFSLTYPHVHDIVVYRGDQVHAGRSPDDESERLRRRAASGSAAWSPVRPAHGRTGAFAHIVALAEPIRVAGRTEGILVAHIDLVGLWPPVNAVRVGTHGFVRLLANDGQLLAHGDPEERRFVFRDDAKAELALVAAAREGRIARNQRGQNVLATVADVPGTSWVVTVEQPVAEAYAAASAMRRDLWILVGVALVVVVIVGLLLGGRIVRPLERLRAHTRLLGRGELDVRIDPRTSISEVRALAEGMNEMAASLAKLEEEAKARELLTTFARIAAGLAHDLRLPIEAVRTACDAVVANPEDVEAVNLVRTVHRRDLPRLKEFVDDLRMLSQRSEGELQAEPVDPSQLAAEVVDHLSGYAKWRGTRFVAEGAGPALEVNRKLLRRALFNLAANGADACGVTGPGGKVTISVRERDAMVCFEISDTGSGIPPERLATLLDGDFASTKRSSGIGLGLGVVRHVAQVHNGHLAVESEVGVGTTFRLTLPPCEPIRDAHGRR